MSARGGAVAIKIRDSRLDLVIVPVSDPRSVRKLPSSPTAASS